jgi:hypothetical protein
MNDNHVGVTTIERLDQGHLYPLGERRDKHVTGGARTSALLHRRRPLYLKSYPDSLYAGYSEPLLGLMSGPTTGPLHFLITSSSSFILQQHVRGC